MQFSGYGTCVGTDHPDCDCVSSELVSGCYHKACDVSNRKFTSASLLAARPIRGCALSYLVGVYGLYEESSLDDKNDRLINQINRKMNFN